MFSKRHTADIALRTVRCVTTCLSFSCLVIYLYEKGFNPLTK